MTGGPSARVQHHQQFFRFPVLLPGYKSNWRKSQTTSVLVLVVWPTWSNRGTGSAPQMLRSFFSFLVCGPPATLKTIHILFVNINVFIHNSLLSTTLIYLARIYPVNVYIFSLFHKLKLAISTCGRRLAPCSLHGAVALFGSELRPQCPPAACDS